MSIARTPLWIDSAIWDETGVKSCCDEFNLMNLNRVYYVHDQRVYDWLWSWVRKPVRFLVSVDSNISDWNFMLYEYNTTDVTSTRLMLIIIQKVEKINCCRRFVGGLDNSIGKKLGYNLHSIRTRGCRFESLASFSLQIGSVASEHQGKNNGDPNQWITPWLSLHSR